MLERNYGFEALAGVTEGLPEVLVVEAVARPGLLSTAITSFVKSMLSCEYIKKGTPLMLMPDLSNTKSRLLALTFSITTSVISLTIPSRTRISCSCNCRSRVWRKSPISRSMFLMLAILSSRSFAICVFLSELRADDSSCLFKLLISSSDFL